MRRVNSLDDLTQAVLEEVDFGVDYLNRIAAPLRSMVDRLRELAVDKQVLELELELTERLVLTPRLLREWKDVLRRLVENFRQIFPFLYFFVAFRENGGWKVLVFYGRSLQEPPPGEIEDLIQRALGRVIPSAGEIREVRFEPLNFPSGKEKFPFGPSDVSQLCKVIQLESPSLGAAVGVGIRTEHGLSESALLSLESTLTVLLNLSLSVKAIEFYTKDLEFYATRDPLTGLYNRRAFLDILQAEVERARRRRYPFAVLFLDVDNLKLVNDLYGHEYGDRLLRQVACFLQSHLRRGDLVARYGGDEFLILLPYANLQEAVRIAERLLGDLRTCSLSTPDGKGVPLSCSVGMALFPDHARDPEDLVSVADRAMLRAKTQGKGRVAVPSSEELNATMSDHRERLALLLEAVERGRVVPFFQPIMDLRSRRIVAYEVLMRIVDAGGEVHPAARFIPAAERLGLIFQLEKLLWEKAVEKASRVSGDHLLFFNLSPSTFVREEFRDWLCDLLERYGFPAERIVVELTERESVRDFSALEMAVAELREWGVRLALDDFGSGFSSYRYLKYLPVDFVKIEGEFVRSMLHHEIDRAFVAGAVTLARVLGIRIVAEFVEDERLLEELSRQGVDYAQGYYIGRPAPDLRGGP